MNILAIDPGNVESAYVLLDKETYEPLLFGKVKNEDLLEIIKEEKYEELAIEMIASYGMPVGREVFDTCVFIGRCVEAAKNKKAKDLQKDLREFSAVNTIPETKPFYEYVYRKEEKMNLCGSMKAKDSNIRQALIDRFGEVGTKKNPGFFYGFKKDIWAAMAVGVTYIDRSKKLC